MLSSFEKLQGDAESFYKKDEALSREYGAVIEGTKPYFKKHSNKGVLLIHGFAASPDELLPLAYELEKYDYSVYVVRVAGHMSNIQDFVNSTYNQWYKSIELGYNCLASFCDKICVIGQSNGGLLATAVAYYNKVDCLALLAPAYKVKVPGFFLIPYIRKVIKYIPRKVKDTTFNYPVFPTQPLYQMKLLQEEVAEFASNINVPVLLAVSNNDILISPKKAQEVVLSMKTEDITIMTYNNKEHDVKHILTERKSTRIINDIALWVKENLK